jgi:hypothetical protein
MSRFRLYSYSKNHYLLFYTLIKLVHTSIAIQSSGLTTGLERTTTFKKFGVLVMKFSQRICWSSLGLSLVVASIGCLKPTDSGTTEPRVQTRKIIGKTTQNVLELKAATEAGGVPASMAVTSSAIGVAADAYRTSVGTMAVLAVEQRMQMHQAQFGELPKDYESFMVDIISPGKPDGLQLPMLPYYQEYAYDPTSHKLIVVEFPNKKKP